MYSCNYMCTLLTIHSNILCAHGSLHNSEYVTPNHKNFFQKSSKFRVHWMDACTGWQSPQTRDCITDWQCIHAHKECAVTLHMQHGYILHNHPYISSSDTLVGTRFTATYLCRDGCVECNHVQCHSTFLVWVCILCQPVIQSLVCGLCQHVSIHPAIPDLHLFDFWKKS